MIEADLSRYHHLNLDDLYRGELSLSHVAALVRRLPAGSELVSVLHDGQPPLSRIEDLLCDLWVVLVQANSEKGSLPDDFDHPVRARIRAKAKAAHVKALREKFRQRQAAYAESRTA